MYEPTFKGGDDLFDSKVTKDLQWFKENSDVIIANRWNKDLDNVKNKVYTRDLYSRD